MKGALEGSVSDLKSKLDLAQKDKLRAEDLLRDEKEKQARTHEEVQSLALQLSKAKSEVIINNVFLQKCFFT